MRACKKAAAVPDNGGRWQFAPQTKVTIQDDGGRLMQGCTLRVWYRESYSGRIVNIHVWLERIEYW
jgi:hypothetical protein